MFQDLLEPDYGVNEEPLEASDINQYILYFNDEEFPEFKTLLKRAMRTEFPVSFQQANVSDTLLLILRKHYSDGTKINP